MKILYKFASRSRSERLFKCLDNIQAMATNPDYQIEVTADWDDETMCNDEVRDKIKTYKNTRIMYGSSLNKVDAINRDLEFFQDWDILINMSDDFEFIIHGFDSLIVKDFEHYRSLDILMHYPDQAAGAALCTMAIMGKHFYKRLGYIYNPEYKSLFCDNEQHEVAVLLNRYVFVKRRMFNHNHPAWGLNPTDALHVHTESFYYEDEATYKRRKSINFGI